MKNMKTTLIVLAGLFLTSGCTVYYPQTSNSNLKSSNESYVNENYYNELNAQRAARKYHNKLVKGELVYLNQQ